ncbi:ATP-binding protein [Sphingomonas sp. dw_22]|uniref:ATP-binding protein n=1 Tax=Sphingomonas sp. dw_22 TaxID=2721175 RepID=UPI001BD3D70E|nr:ATP-binding protein [Sphingomonas sp. dw_22]
MPLSPGLRALVALAVAALTALVSLLISGDVQIGLVVLVGAAAATLIAATGENAPAPVPPAPPAAPARGPAISEVIEAIAEPVLMIDANRVVEANPAARALLGQHILGEDVRLAIRHPAAAERLLDPTDQSPAAPIHLVGLGTRDQRWEMRVRTLENGQRIVHLIDRTGSYATERIRVDFVANASHELRTPLASLLGYVETLQDDAGDDPATRQRFLKIMHDEARRMQRLIDDLISLSRIEAEKYRAPADSVALADLVDEVCLELSGAARAADLVTEVEEVPPVRGDRAQLSQLIHNVVGNAMKYGKHGTPVTIALRREGDAMVRLTVTDQGEGIPPEHIPRLTERFYRVDSGRSRSLGGTGLGLAIVKHVVERHRGRIDIASTVGKGTSVSVLLPVQRGA